MIKRSDTDGYRAQAVRSHLCQNIDIARDERALGNNRYRVAAALQHLQDFPRYAMRLFDGLVGIGVCTQSNSGTLITGAG